MFNGRCAINAISLPQPGIQHGPYPDFGRPDATRVRRDRAGLADFGPTLKLIRQSAENMDGVSDAALSARAHRLAETLRREGTSYLPCVEAFALTASAAQRQLGIRFHDEQLYAGWALLRGDLIEMQTGEGKTVTATLPACVAALAGTPVHVVTTNDYLVARDAADMTALYNAVGLTAGTALGDDDEEQRRHAYAADITYVNNKQVVFDYLLDRARAGAATGLIRRRIGGLLNDAPRAGPAIMRGLYFALIDEADSVLIDDVRTPLVMSRRADDALDPSVYPVALGLASRMTDDQDFYKSPAHRRVVLTEAGEAHLAELCSSLSGVWTTARFRQDLVEKALVAMHLMQPRRDYLVRDGHIVLVDENTGRAVPERTLRNGLHQMVESKERCRLTDPAETVSQLTYRRFFARYLKLAGMSGTIAESAGELRSVYGLRTVKIPTHKPCVRRYLPARLLPDMPAKRDALVAEVRAVHAQRRPVLVGVRSIAEAKWASAALTDAGLPHRLLDADNSSEEAEIIASAGQMEAITVATNMAGRGTDIKLGAGVGGLGGLHVIVASQNDARRIDRQLIGRCGRQGDAGSCRVMLSFEDEVMVLRLEALLRSILARLGTYDNSVSRLLGTAAARLVQRRSERVHAHERRMLQRLDQRLEDLLAFAGGRD